MFVRCVARASTLSGRLRSASLRKLYKSTSEAQRGIAFCGGWMASRLPAGFAILIAGASPALSPSCESVRAVIDQFQDIYHDKETDELSLEKQNLALREEVLRDSSTFKHPCQSRSWIWKCFYWALRRSVHGPIRGYNASFALCFLARGRVGRVDILFFGSVIWQLVTQHSAYLLALWTPSALLYILSKVTDNAALRELWLDLTVWTFETSGCIFIKFAQWCSMRPDMFAMEVIDKLKVLQQVTVTHSMAHTRHEIRASFGRELEEIFSEFDPVPIASGSIAQVHHARLRSNGQEVAVKVRHPSVIEQSYVDLNIISSFVLAGKAMLIAPSLPFDREGIITHLQRQVDLSIEAQNLRLFRANFARWVEYYWSISNYWSKYRDFAHSIWNAFENQNTHLVLKSVLKFVFVS